MGKEQYIKRHYTVCAELHFNIYKKIGEKLYNKQWYDHVPKLVETGHEGKVTVLILILIYLLIEIGLTPGGSSRHPVAVVDTRWQ